MTEAATGGVLSKNVFLKVLQISQENTCVGVFLIKFVKNFVKKRLQHNCFPVKFGKFLRTPILRNICERLLPSRLQWPTSILILKLQWSGIKTETLKHWNQLNSSKELNYYSFVYVESNFPLILVAMVRFGCLPFHFLF